MKAPVAALAWQLWLRNRLGLLGMVVAVILGALVLRLLPDAVRAREALKYVVFGSVLLFSYAISMFTYSNFASGAIHDSLRFPARMFQLPIRTSMLVAVPMLGGMAFCALLWALMSALFFRPLGLDPPFVMPALGLAAALGFFQVLAWFPLGSPVFRAGTATILGSAAVLLSVHAQLGLQWPVWLPWLMLGGGIAAAYPVAVLGVARDRRGDAITGAGFIRSILDRSTDWIIGNRAGFPTVRQAQLWFELRTKALPFAVISIMMFGCIVTMSMLFVREDPGAARLLFTVACGVPLWSAAMFGPALGKPNLWGTRYELSSFVANRPVSTGDVYVSVLRAAFWAELSIWVVVIVTAALRFAFLGAPGGFVAAWNALQDQHGGAMAALYVAGLVAALVTFCFGLLTGGLTLGLAGRVWVLVGGMMLKSVMVMLILWKSSAIWATLKSQPEMQSTATAVLAAVLLAKVATAVLALQMSNRRGWINARTAAVLLIWWIAGAALLGLLAVTALPTGAVPLPTVGVLIAAALLLPLVQPALGPAALAWNRHR